MSLENCESSNAGSNSTESNYRSWWWPEHDVSLSGVVKSMKQPHLGQGVDPWGFVIYRCTYGSDAAWKRMIDLIKSNLKGKATDLSLNQHPEEGWDDLDVQDLLPRHELTLIEDRDKLDGATSHEVRDHFTKWVQDELIHKVPDAPEEIHRALTNCPPDSLCPEACLGPRYNFCLFVDDICLESLHEMSTPVMKILWKEPARREPNDRQYDVNPDWEDGETDDWEEDVGWMYIRVDEYFKFYDLFEDDSWWYDFYSRPPYMLYSGLCFPGDIPGSWRPKSDEHSLRFKLRLRDTGEHEICLSNTRMTCCDTNESD
ncbi:hypothetical protein ZTR_03662 [Talaromyces verruculosus]|nr:hypothetical protein ZTR_03662 [Talaromyces verruculosus]